MKSEFQKAAAHVCAADPHSCDQVVLGDQSLVVKAIDRAVESGDYQPVVEGIDLLLADKPKLEDCLGWDAGYPVAHGRAVLEGLKSTLAGLGQWRTNSGSGAKNLANVFRAAIERFEFVWGDGTRPNVNCDSPQLSHADEDVLWRLFAELGKNGTNAGFWITWDLVDRLRSRSCGQPVRHRVHGSATTPILGRQEPFSGVVLWLTVELLECAGCGFDPDPLALALTAVRNAGNKNGEGDFVASLRDVWRKSGLTGEFRGRWRIASQCPDGDAKFAAAKPVHVPRLTGRSAEAATLAAIWAASGKVPYAEEFGTLGELALDVAISASVGDGPPGEPLTSIPLQGVKSEKIKIQTAAARGIDTLLLATDEAKSEEESDIVKKVHDAARHQQTYTGLRIERVSTMGEAMDLLLVTNRHQRAWQKHVETEWQGLWEQGTATLEAMGG